MEAYRNFYIVQEKRLGELYRNDSKVEGPRLLIFENRVQIFTHVQYMLETLAYLAFYEWKLHSDLEHKKINLFNARNYRKSF